jgi:hypothetical protein
MEKQETPTQTTEQAKQPPPTIHSAKIRRELYDILKEDTSTDPKVYKPEKYTNTQPHKNSATTMTKLPKR